MERNSIHKLSKFVLRSHVDKIGDRNDVWDVGASSSICVCPLLNLSPPPGPKAAARAPGPTAVAVALTVRPPKAPRVASPGPMAIHPYWAPIATPYWKVHTILFYEFGF